MSVKLLPLYFIVLSLSFFKVSAQNVALFDQSNGHCDFLFFGNTLNVVENGTNAPCTILTSSSAMLNLNPGDQITKAFLYWAGSGTGDLDVKLNGFDVTAARHFNLIQTTSLRPYFSAFADVTALVQSIGTGNYTLSELDLTAVIGPYCPNGGNFGGWAVVVLYENPALPLNQINVYDGLQGVPTALTITLDNLNVIDSAGSKIGFVAWEGDRSIAVNETLRINNIIVGNPPLNPNNNAFNGTNSFTGSTVLYNMDLDVYDIQNFIDVGDTSAEISLTSGQDFVMINAVVTKLNSRLPDATIAIQNVEVSCDQREILVPYTVYNLNASEVLPAGVSIAFYADGQLLQTTFTQTEIALDGSETGAILLVVPQGFPTDFTLTVKVDDNGLGMGAIIELNENNNEAVPVNISIPLAGSLPLLPDLFSCNQGLLQGLYDLRVQIPLASSHSTDVVTFHELLEEAQSGTNAIENPAAYTSTATPTTIFVRVTNPICYALTSFLLKTRNCPPTVYNFVSANGDGQNDDFFIAGLRDVFTNFQLSVYNRWGQLVWTGNNQSANWNGHNNQGMVPFGQTTPDGTYFYILELNDPDYPKPLKGFVYVTR